VKVILPHLFQKKKNRHKKGLFIHFDEDNEVDKCRARRETIRFPAERRACAHELLGFARVYLAFYFLLFTRKTL